MIPMIVLSHNFSSTSWIFMQVIPMDWQENNNVGELSFSLFCSHLRDFTGKKQSMVLGLQQFSGT